MNTDSRTVNSLRNITTGFAGHILQNVLGFVCRTIFIRYLAAEYLGINGLFGSILAVLTLTELGIGTAFTYSLYKPLAEKDELTIATVLRLYKKAYVIIGCLVFVIGIGVIPFLDYFIAEKPANIAHNLTLIYLFFLFNTASSYFFSYKTSLLNADQRNYITTINYAIFYIIQNIIQIVVLITTQNFILYLATQLILQFLSNISISMVVNKMYPFLRNYKNETLNPEIKKTIISNAKATFVIRFGGVMVKNTDNIIINHFSGLLLLGYLTNYQLLIAILTTIISQVFTNIASSVAQVNAIESKEKQYEIFNMLNFSNFWVYGISSIGVIFLMNDFILLWAGKDYVLPMEVSIMLAINFFMVGMQNSIWTFKTTYGFFNEGKYLVLLTAVLNLVFSFVLGHWLGIVGILLATALARLIGNFWYDPYIVFKLGLKMDPLIYLKKFLHYLVLIVCSTLLLYYIMRFFQFSTILNIVLKAAVCLIIPNLIIIAFYRKTPEFIKIKQTISKSLSIITNKFKRS